MQRWSPTSWQQFSYQQAAIYPDDEALSSVVEQLQGLPPLVKSEEIDRLKKDIRLAGRGEAFILQAGDCAESFQDCRPEVIHNKLKIILQMSLILSHGLQKPIIQIGRIAGQYAKPRSSDFETINDITLPSYRGDLVNLPLFDALSRRPNPEHMLKAYACSATTIEWIRNFLDQSLNDLNHPDQWDFSFIQPLQQAAQAHKYHAMVKHKDPFYTSHEALHLHYEQALTHQSPQGAYYNLSTHLPWVGMRTAQLGSAHIEFIRGIENPVGIKIGPSTRIECLQKIVKMINPRAEEGRLLLISRFGSKQIATMLPIVIRAIKKTGIPVTWSCDPMHGNTEITANGTKTRHFNKILSELQQAITIHQQLDTQLGGVHFELTGDNVTECIGGARNLNEADLKQAYHSLVDPRLNYEQSLEMALQLSSTWISIYKAATLN